MAKAKAQKKALPKIIESKINMSEAVSELERCYNLFNKSLYAGKLPRPLITIQSAGRMNAYGWFSRAAWNVKKNQVPEINICAEHLNRPVMAVMSTLIHEMVHLDNAVAGIEDCSVNQYHNKKFKTAAEKIGFEVEEMGRFGYAKTVLSQSLKDLIVKAKPDQELLGAFRCTFSRAKKGSKLKKWSCGCTNIRVGAKEFAATCDFCGKKFKCVDPTSDNYEGDNDGDEE